MMVRSKGLIASRLCAFFMPCTKYEGKGLFVAVQRRYCAKRLWFLAVSQYFLNIRGTKNHERVKQYPMLCHIFTLTISLLLFPCPCKPSNRAGEQHFDHAKKHIKYHPFISDTVQYIKSQKDRKKQANAKVQPTVYCWSKQQRERNHQAWKRHKQCKRKEHQGSGGSIVHFTRYQSLNKLGNK